MDAPEWREKFVAYYRANAPEKEKMVTDTMMAKWAGRYEELYANMERKYGPLGQPQAPAPARKPLRSAGNRSSALAAGGAAHSKHSVDDFAAEFADMVADAAPRDSSLAEPRDAHVVDAKSANATNGLETSTFTVCTRIRPPLAGEDGVGDFCCVLPGARQGSGHEHSEQALLLAPKVSLQGLPKLDKSCKTFDYVFGPADSNDDVFSAVGAPLVARAMSGQVSVVFAYGQTGSGKTHTMNGLMDGIVPLLFGEERAVRFSYFEALGTTVSDCLVREQAPKGVQIGEGLDGRIITKGLSEHVVGSASELAELVEVAKSRRSTAATAKNDASSRSHGIGVIRIGQPGSASGASEGASPAEGVIYVIDLAGSERAADSKGHSKARMDETKQINLSLMALKECIRARTLASAPGEGGKIHVPYRRTKLTMLLKDVFEHTNARLCATVVIAAVSPLAKDIAHSANTLKYAEPLRVAALKPMNIERDPRDPALWDCQQITDWVSEAAAAAGGAGLDAAQLVEGLNGVQMCALPEPELFRRTLAQLPDGAAVAKALYDGLWAMIVDAKSRNRRPDGSIVTAEEEAAELAAAEAEMKAKTALWAEREKHLAAGRVKNRIDGR